MAKMKRKGEGRKGHNLVYDGEKKYTDTDDQICNDPRLPSSVIDCYWIICYKGNFMQEKKYGEHGKWLIFCHYNFIDAVWDKIRWAAKYINIINDAKCSTRKINSNSTNTDQQVICVYCWENQAMEIREKLRIIGITHKIGWKSDNASREGKYAVNGDTNICKMFC